MPDGPRYEDDFYAWTQHQAEVLRTMPVSDNRFDREHVAEEIEDLGKSERDAVRSQIRRIIEHFLKLAYSPAEQPRVNWMETIDDARELLSDKLTATLRRDVEGSLEKLYVEGRRRAARGLRRHGEADVADRLPQQCPYPLDEICQEDWYPVSTEQ
ncbi:MAG: DUF29 domain-containing protein [Alphaproteobacteria bacterium]|nr:DUF29 domain-containing protein [Alphaproteobacteria bacterium]